jgi:hypothetical protein
LSAGSLPTGLTLSPNGTLTGIPTTPGTVTFSVQVKDSAGNPASKQLAVTISPAPLTITTDTLPSAAQGAAYSQTLTATGGAGAYTWLINGGALPTGLTMDPTGRITGTVTGTTSSFVAQVTDATGTTVTKNLTITVAAGPTFPGSGTLPAGTVATSYSTTIAVNGGQPPYTLSVVAGQLPPGLSLNANTGEISGKPTQAGSFSITVQARDAAGAQSQKPFTLAINAGPTITTAPILPSAGISLAYAASIVASGGTPPYTWSATAGTVPAGLTFHADGKIDGTPIVAGSFTFTATVIDANRAASSKDFTLTVQAGLTITTAPQLPSGVPGAAYSAALAAVGGATPYVWSVTAGAIPNGLQLDASTGALSGTPATPGNYTFTVTVKDAANTTAQKAFTLVVAPGVTFTTPAALPDATAGTPYSFTLQAGGGQAPYTWRIADGALPDGLALNATTGTIAGTPQAPGTFNFTVEVTDAANLKASRVHTIVATLPGVPTLNITGIPTNLAPLQQPSIDVALSAPYPVAITGRLILSFTPANGMPDDPSVQFSSGGRSAAFTIAANATHATFAVPQLALQSGSVAGSIQVAVDSLAAGSVPLPATGMPAPTAQVPAGAFIKSVSVTRTPGGFTVQIVGLSTSRELTGATVRFLPSTGATLPTTEATVPLNDPAKAWFQSAGSTAYGGQFTLTLPFSIVGGTVPLDSVAVTLTNSAGSSQEVAAPY